MFKGHELHDVFQHYAVKFQPLWIQYRLLPGKLGLGPPPPAGHKTGVELIPGHKPALDHFRPGGRSLTQDFPPPCSSPCPPSPDDLKAMSMLAQPAVLYDPGSDVSLPNQISKDPTVPSCGPGKVAQWPAELAGPSFECSSAGEVIFDVNDPAKLLANGKMSDWRLVNSLPHGAPRALMTAATRTDIKAMQRDCDQDQPQPPLYPLAHPPLR